VKARIAVVGAGIYGSYSAIRLAEAGHSVELFDPLGILCAASHINQFRIHSGYHYPRSPETIKETQEARSEFIAAFTPSIVQNSRNYYAIPKAGSLTSPDSYEEIMARHHLPLTPCKPDWINFEFIDRCYEVDEQIYDPQVLRVMLQEKLCTLGVMFCAEAYMPSMRGNYDYVIFATYGLGPSRDIFKLAKYQVAEKILIELPSELRNVALVVVDGPFTAFDPYGKSGFSQFGSAKNTNHWTTTNPNEQIPHPYVGLLNAPAFQPVPFTRFEAMRSDACLAVPLAKEAIYKGSRFTMRVVEDNPEQDRRVLYLKETSPREIHVFSGKVVSAVKAARLICERIARGD
jgi:FAD dependent oxidoreductase